MRVTPYILAGGRSTRMGQDKAFLRLGGPTLLELALARASVLGEPRILGGDAVEVDRHRRLQWYAPVVADRVAQAGPLGGMDAALQDSPTDWLLVLPVDQPYLPGAALAQWVAEVEHSCAQAAWFTHPAGTEPLPLMLHRSLTEPIAAALQRGERRLLPVVQAAAERAFIAFRPQSEWFVNLNSPADLPNAETVTGP